MALPFAKAEGAGNDFIVLADRLEPLEAPSELARVLCDRHMGIGGDGLIEMERLDADTEASFRVRCFNSDGSPILTCLNAFRCAALRAVEMGWASRGFSFMADRGAVDVRIDGDQIAVVIGPPEVCLRHVALPPGAPSAEASLVSLGDPHLVVLFDAGDLAGIDFAAAARPLREWTGASPAGANVHFVAPNGEGFSIRSYERGIEGETLACGSGCVAAARIVAGDMEDGPSRLVFDTAGGHCLRVSAHDTGWSIAGPARTVFTGEWSN